MIDRIINNSRYDYEPKIFIYRCSGDVVGEIVHSERQESKLENWLNLIDARYHCETLKDALKFNINQYGI
jgi:hypothetical protein